jgi:ADP-ribosylglycohydrolase
MDSTHTARLARALASLEGLSIGDAFGERFFLHQSALLYLQKINRKPQTQDFDLGTPPWFWTDDTAMALSLVATLQIHKGIDLQYLAQDFSARYVADPHRGYGPAMHKLLPQLRHANAWQTAPKELFSGQGSFGNGAAMRVSPIGAYFADDLNQVVEHARRSAIVTHAHDEAVAGAIAIAVATALATRLYQQPKPEPAQFLEQVLALTPESEVASGIRHAINLRHEITIQSAASVLGNGSKISAPDTVPFVLWCAAWNLTNYEDAIWTAVSGLGDMDTTCAMVGGIVAMYTGMDAIPAVWREGREPLPIL